jgi:hypothetical protein
MSFSSAVAQAPVASSQMLLADVVVGTVIRNADIAAAGSTYEFYEDPFVRLRAYRTSSVTNTFWPNFLVKIGAPTTNKFIGDTAQGTSAIGGTATLTTYGWYNSSTTLNTWVGPTAGPAPFPDTGYWGAAAKGNLHIAGLGYVYRMTWISDNTNALYEVTVERVRLTQFSPIVSSKITLTC